MTQVADENLINGSLDKPAEPNLLQQTLELARVLMQIADKNPEGRPSASAAAVFKHWLSVARNSTEEPQYFDDVAENYDVEGRSNKDLFDLFELLHPYVEIPYTDDEPLEADPEAAMQPPKARKFIELPTL